MTAICLLRAMSHAAKLLAEAAAHHQAARYDEAEKAYRKLLRVDAVNKDGLRLLGGLYLQTRQWAKAADCLEKAARFLANDPETLTNLGVALHNMGRADDAALRYQQALAVRPDYLQALGNLGSYYQDKGQAARALPILAQALKASKDLITHLFHIHTWIKHTPCKTM